MLIAPFVSIAATTLARLALRILATNDAAVVPVSVIVALEVEADPGTLTVMVKLLPTTYTALPPATVPVTFTKPATLLR